MARRKRRPRRRRQPAQKRRKQWVGGGGLGTLLKASAKIGVKLGKDERYKRMGGKGVGGAVSNFRRKPWEV